MEDYATLERARGGRNGELLLCLGGGHSQPAIRRLPDRRRTRRRMRRSRPLGCPPPHTHARTALSGDAPAKSIFRCTCSSVPLRSPTKHHHTILCVGEASRYGGRWPFPSAGTGDTRPTRLAATARHCRTAAVSAPCQCITCFDFRAGRVLAAGPQRLPNRSNSGSTETGRARLRRRCEMNDRASGPTSEPRARWACRCVRRPGYVIRQRPSGLPIAGHVTAPPGRWRPSDGRRREPTCCWATLGSAGLPLTSHHGRQAAWPPPLATLRSRALGAAIEARLADECDPW